METKQKPRQLKGVIPPKITEPEEQLKVIRRIREFVKRYPGLGEEVMKLREEQQREELRKSGHLPAGRDSLHYGENMMQMTVNVPETLPKDVLQELITQFEAYLKEEAQNMEKQSSSSKWERIAHEAHEESPLYGLSGYVLECSKEIRDNFVFPHDEEEK